MQRPNRRRVAGAAATTLTACSLFAAATLPAAAMTVTFIRHGESYGNSTGHIDTSVPGPNLTATGEAQADAVATYLQSEEYTEKYGPVDAIYASTMIRTQQTAKPLHDATGMDVTILGFPKNDNAGQNIGVQEISAGIFEGLPESEGIGRIGYILAPLAWTMGLQFVPVPGGETGLEFNERMTNALTQVAENTPEGDDQNQNAAVFSHGATIMMWTMMNVDNPNLLLIVQHPLSNTDVVVVESNGEGGWTLKSWDGQEVGDADYATKMFVNFRDLIVAPQKAVYDMRIPVLSFDAQAIAEAGAQGVQDVGAATVKFVKDSITDTVDAITGIPGSLKQPATSQTSKQVSTLAAAAPAPAAKVAEDAEGADLAATDETHVQTPAEGTDKDTGKVVSLAKTDAATDLTAGKESGPEAPRAVARQTVRDAVSDARDQVSSSVHKLRDTAKKVTGQDKKAGTEASDNDSTHKKATPKKANAHKKPAKKESKKNAA
ncbi:histidine phosphatase family protein [Mycobacterium sp. TNTM28]|uniref:Histidine phosphatase family protein n=1 Tax=[Mycobacterium] fortunisiensis TaxID=2600579 RepID=A0ABS6KT89_9MYCO|nr:histidine phosphatase family protein [[Mycobacterium] fortunisiensis]MBU9766798.1 histidine phosphatase family protein [[Mycobacterium] fortunisiensis]